MIRVKDHEKSLKFYQEVVGMSLLRTVENKDAKFNLYFLGYTGGKEAPTTSASGVSSTANREGILELTWNYGTEKDASFKYHNGNDEPQGFGHICKTGPTSSSATTDIRQAFPLII
jgi:lactoylglutathione lyase